MKKLGKVKVLAIGSLSAVVLVASIALAQSVKTHRANRQGPRHEWNGEGMKLGFHEDDAFLNRLNLTDDQKAKIKQIRESFAERNKPLRKSFGRSGRSCARRVKAVRSMKRWPLRN